MGTSTLHFASTISLNLGLDNQSSPGKSSDSPLYFTLYLTIDVFPHFFQLSSSVQPNAFHVGEFKGEMVNKYGALAKMKHKAREMMEAILDKPSYYLGGWREHLVDKPFFGHSILLCTLLTHRQSCRDSNIFRRHAFGVHTKKKIPKANLWQQCKFRTHFCYIPKRKDGL